MRLWGVALLALSAACSATGAHDGRDALRVRVIVDKGQPGSAPAERDVRVAADATALDATRAAVAVVQDYVCCTSEDVWAIDGLGSDAARDGYWTWWLDGELGPGFAHQVPVRDGATIEWRYRLADPEGRGAEPVARLAVLSAAACAAVEAFGGRRNLVAHGPDCNLAAHAELPRLSPAEAHSAVRELELHALVDADEPADGARDLRFAPGAGLEDWETLGAACGRLGAARVAWTARRRAP